MAQRLWHSLPIWVTSTSASPISSVVSKGSDATSMPDVVMFSAKSPGPTVRPAAIILSTDSWASRLTCLCHVPE